MQYGSGLSRDRIVKLCRYDDDRLGVVRGDLVRDVTQEIGRAHV